MSPVGFIDENGKILNYDSVPNDGDLIIMFEGQANVDAQYPVMIGTYSEGPNYSNTRSFDGNIHPELTAYDFTNKLDIFRAVTKKLATYIPYEYAQLNGYYTFITYTPEIETKVIPGVHTYRGSNVTGVGELGFRIPEDSKYYLKQTGRSNISADGFSAYYYNGLFAYNIKTVMYDPTINGTFDQIVYPKDPGDLFYHGEDISRKYGPRGWATCMWDPDTNELWYANASLYRATADERFLGCTLDEYNQAAIAAAQKLGCRWKYDLCLVDARVNYDAVVPASERPYRTYADAIAAVPNDFGNFN